MTLSAALCCPRRFRTLSHLVLPHDDSYFMERTLSEKKNRRTQFPWELSKHVCQSGVLPPQLWQKPPGQVPKSTRGEFISALTIFREIAQNLLSRPLVSNSKDEQKTRNLCAHSLLASLWLLKPSLFHSTLSEATAGFNLLFCVSVIGNWLSACVNV